MPAILALAAALVYGASDFFGGVASRRATAIAVVAWSQILGLVLLGLALAALGVRATSGDVAWGAVCGIFGAAAIVALYRGLASGAMGVTSALSAVVGAAVPALYGAAFRGERPPLLADAGIVAALVAVVLLLARDGMPARAAGAALYGLIAGAMFGGYFITLAQTRPAAGLVPLFAARACTVVLLAVGAAVLRRPDALHAPRPAWRAIALCGLFDVSANVLFVTAFHLGGMISLVAVLTSLYPGTTVALAALALRERLSRLQWIGVALALGGAAAIAAG